MKRSWLIVFFVLLSAAAVKADATLEGLREKLVFENRKYGPAVEEEEIYGRVVVFWNVTNYIHRWRLVANSSSSNNEYNKAVEDDFKAEFKALRKVAQKDIKEGRLFVILTVTMPNSFEDQEAFVEKIRDFKPPQFSVYSIPGNNIYFDATGVQKGSFKSIASLATDETFVKVLKSTPKYVPGRFVFIQSKFFEPACRQMVRGKNIDGALSNLRSAARGSGERADEAKEIVAEVESALERICSDIDTALENAPSVAVDKIMVLQKTSPNTGRKYAGDLGALLANPEVRQLADTRRFVKEARHGKKGRSDTGRLADGHVRKMQGLQKSKNPAVAAEAAHLEEELEPYTQTALDKAHEEERAQKSEERAKRKERERQQRANNRNY